MKPIEFDIKIRNYKTKMLYDPYIGTIYEKKLFHHFESMHLQSHPFQQYKEEENELIKIDPVQHIANENSMLILETTRQCNLRCKYCIFNEDYSYRGEYENKYMSEKIIDQTALFYKELKAKADLVNNKKFLINFYGGEPGLEADLVLYAIDKFNDIFKQNKPEYLITTNGTFHKNTKLINRIKSEKIKLNISLDGPLDENDKFRVYKSEKGVYNDIMTLVKKLNNHPITFLATLHPNHNWDKINDYFTKLHIKYSNINVGVNFIRLFGYEKSDAEVLKDSLNNKHINFQNKIISKTYNNIPLSFFEQSYIKILNKDIKFGLKPYWPFLKQPKTCYPGARRLFVDINGNITVCERSAPQLTIGNVNEGITSDKVNNTYKILKNAALNSNCHKCEVKNFCMTCFAKLQTTDSLSYYIKCDNQIKEQFYNRIKFAATLDFIKT